MLTLPSSHQLADVIVSARCVASVAKHQNAVQILATARAALKRLNYVRLTAQCNPRRGGCYQRDGNRLLGDITDVRVGELGKCIH